MGSNRTKVDDTTWGKNGEGWFWVLAGFGIGFLILAAFLDAPGILVVCPFVGGLLGNSLRIIRSLKKEMKLATTFPLASQVAPQKYFFAL